METLKRDGKIVLTPCKKLTGKSVSSYDDRFIIDLAIGFDAAIISNDNYRDLAQESESNFFLMCLQFNFINLFIPSSSRISRNYRVKSNWIHLV